MSNANNLPAHVEFTTHTGMNGYHSMVGRRMDNVNDSNPYRIGFEVEKMNVTAKSLIEAHEPLAPGWVAERDGSLDGAGAGGYELISPAYNICFQERINTALEAMATFIDAEPANRAHANACGGHIHISDSRVTADALADRIKPLFPLLMVMYPTRLRNAYVNCNKFGYMKRRTGNKYQPFYIRSSEIGRTIEFRIFPHVKSVKQLKWRMRLICYFLNAAKHGSLTFDWMAKELMNSGSGLCAILSEVYTQQELKQKATMYWSAAAFFFTDRPLHEVVQPVFGAARMNRTPIY
jgi:hypothetical protein